MGSRIASLVNRVESAGRPKSPGTAAIHEVFRWRRGSTSWSWAPGASTPKRSSSRWES